MCLCFLYSIFSVLCGINNIIENMNDVLGLI